jgi:hypothetical protein
MPSIYTCAKVILQHKTATFQLPQEIAYPYSFSALPQIFQEKSNVEAKLWHAALVARVMHVLLQGT